MTAGDTGKPVKICSGEVLVTVEPSPSCPLPLSPHAQRVPSARRATVKFLPAATAVQPSKGTCTGEALPLVLPIPSWPLELSPHAQRVPSARRATVKFEPAATAVHVKDGTICSGQVCCVVEPSPNWPLALFPHAQRVLSDLKARAKSFPAVTAVQVVTVLICMGDELPGPATPAQLAARVVSPRPEGAVGLDCNNEVRPSGNGGPREGMELPAGGRGSSRRWNLSPIGRLRCRPTPRGCRRT